MQLARSRVSAVIVWGMIPLAILAGTPSTGCFCASGRFMLLCAHGQQVVAGPHANHDVAGDDCCAGDDFAADDLGGGECQLCSTDVHSRGEPEGDCCQHGDASPSDGVGSRSCCQPVLNALSMGSAPMSAPADGASAAVADCFEPPAVAHFSIAAYRVDFDTGPPLDRIIVFRHLLI